MDTDRKEYDWMHWPLFPVMYIHTELAIATDRGLSIEDLIQESGLDQGSVTGAVTKISPAINANLMNLIIQRSGNHGLGFEIALRAPPITQSNLGSALYSSRTLRDVLAIMERFWHVCDRSAKFSHFEMAGWMIVDIHDLLGAKGDLKIVFLDCILTTMYLISHRLLGDIKAHAVIWLECAEPDYYAQYRDRLPPIRYGMSANQIHISVDVLDQFLPMSNPIALTHALSRCEQESDLLGGRDGEVFLHQVRKLLVWDGDRYPSSEMLAKRFHMSLRTFRRRLQLLGTGYKQLLDDTRNQDAIRLLEHPALSIQTIAELLGYINPTNFSRAFRKHMGYTPSEYRTLRKVAL